MFPQAGVYRVVLLIKCGICWDKYSSLTHKKCEIRKLSADNSHNRAHFSTVYPLECKQKSNSRLTRRSANQYAMLKMLQHDGFLIKVVLDDQFLFLWDSFRTG